MTLLMLTQDLLHRASIAEHLAGDGLCAPAFTKTVCQTLLQVYPVSSVHQHRASVFALKFALSIIEHSSDCFTARDTLHSPKNSL